MNLTEAMPKLAEELKNGLLQIHEEHLANTVNNLVITGRCECGDKNCGTFYTLNKEIWAGKKLRQIVPVVDNLYAVDVFEDKIACVEILDRKDVTEILNKLFRKNT